MKPILLPLALAALSLVGGGTAVASPLSAMLVDGVTALREEPPVVGRGALLLDAPASLADDPAVTGALAQGMDAWSGVQWRSPFAVSRAVRDAEGNADRLAASTDATSRLMERMGVEWMVVVKLTLDRRELRGDFHLYGADGAKRRVYESLVRLDTPLPAGTRVVAGVGAPTEGNGPDVAPAGPLLALDGLVGGIAALERSPDGTTELFVGVEDRLLRARLEGARLVPLAETVIEGEGRVIGLFVRRNELFVSYLVSGFLASRVYRVADDGVLTLAAEGLPWRLIDGADGRLYGQAQLPDRSLAPRIVRLTLADGRGSAEPFASLPEETPLSGVALPDLSGDGLPDPVAIDDRQSLVGRLAPDLPFVKLGEGYGGSPLAVARRTRGDAPTRMEFIPPPLAVGNPPRLAVVRNVRESGFLPTAGYAEGSVALLAPHADGWGVVRESRVEPAAVTAFALLPDGRLVAARYTPAPFGGAGRSTLACLTLIDR